MKNVDFNMLIIDPRSNYTYSSFYLFKLFDLFNKSNIRLSERPFKSLPHPGMNLRFVIVNNGKQTKYSIHTDDDYHLQQQDYEWCDVYGCVNANFSHYPKDQYPKLISLVPSFSISILSEKKALWFALQCYIKSFSSIIHISEWNKLANRMEVNIWKNTKHHFVRIYKTTKNRLSYKVYCNELSSEDGYVFFLSTLWYNNNENKNDEGVNLRRKWFIEACKNNPNIHFEGGLLADWSSSRDKFVNVITEQHVPMNEWLEKTKKSAFVFNTPAFWNCHGWKLGEYLALGKCIISTPLSNDLPAPLEHGVNIHFVEDSQEAIAEAVEYVLTHPDYRHKLEAGAKAYWEKYGTPAKSLELLGIK